MTRSGNRFAPDGHNFYGFLEQPVAPTIPARLPAVPNSVPAAECHELRPTGAGTARWAGSMPMLGGVESAFRAASRNSEDALGLHVPGRPMVKLGKGNRFTLIIERDDGPPDPVLSHPLTRCDALKACYTWC